MRTLCVWFRAYTNSFLFRIMNCFVAPHPQVRQEVVVKEFDERQHSARMASMNKPVFNAVMAAKKHDRHAQALVFTPSCEQRGCIHTHTILKAYFIGYQCNMRQTELFV